MLKIKLGNVQVISNFTDEQLEKIKEDLTLDNPKYKQAKKFSKWNNTKIPKYLYFYHYDTETQSIIAPIGYKPPFNFEIVEDYRDEVNVSYPPIRVKLRDTQVDAFNSYLDDPSKGLICMPTGKGKSILGIYLAYRLKQKALVIVHKDDLVVGWKKDIEFCFDNKVVPKLIKAKKREIGDQITIATVQTLNRLSEEELEKIASNFGMVIIDECHHCPSSTYGVIEAFSSPYKIGLSATPERKDGLTPIMNFYLGDFAFKFEYIKEDKDILPVEIIRKDSPVVYEPTVSEKLSSSGNPVYYLDPHGDIKISSIPINKRPRVMFSHLDDLVVKDPQYTKMYIKDIKHEYEEGHSILVLVRLKDHCRYIKEQLEKYIPSEDIQLYYGDSKEPRATLMKRAEDKRQLITIATLSVATEGTNVKQWEVEFLISSINDGKNVEQAIGRIRRTTNKPKLKKVRVYDYRQCNVYSMASHSFTRDSRYRKLKLDNPNAKRPLFSRGYRKN